MISMNTLGWKAGVFVSQLSLGPPVIQWLPQKSAHKGFKITLLTTILQPHQAIIVWTIIC